MFSQNVDLKEGLRTPHPRPREPEDDDEGEELEVIVLKKTGGEVGGGRILHERVGQIDNVSQSIQEQRYIVRIAVLINLTIRNSN